MASINAPAFHPASDEQIAWNQAYERVYYFLATLTLSDKSQVARLTLRIIDSARELHRQDPRHPTILAMERAQRLVIEWLTTNLDMRDKAPSHVFATGYLALFLSRMFQTAPDALLTSQLSDELKQSMRQTLLVTGPDLHISSMTSRDFDYGPIRDLARQTWHRWNTREIFVAFLFWTGTYFVFYWWLSDLL